MLKLLQHKNEGIYIISGDSLNSYGVYLYGVCKKDVKGEVL